MTFFSNSIPFFQLMVQRKKDNERITLIAKSINLSGLGHIPHCGISPCTFEAFLDC